MLTRLFRNVCLVVGLVLVSGFSVVWARGTLNGDCDTPITGHQCLDMTGVSATDRSSPARDCQSGHCVGLGTEVLCCLPAAGASSGPAPDACGATITAMPTRPPDLAAVEASWVCRIPPAATGGQAPCRDFGACHLLNAAAQCCPPNIGTPPGRTSTDAGAAAAGGGSSAGLAGALHLPDCATSHDPQVAGKCSLDDIKQVAVNFANFLMGLAAAFFLLIFVYAGFKYIFFAYDSGTAGEARKMLTSSAIGMLLVLGAATIVRFVQTTATGQAPVQDQCVATKGPTYSCQDFSHVPTAQQTNCTPTSDHLCPGGTNIRCCPAPPGTGLRPAGTATAQGTPGACNIAGLTTACHTFCDNSACAMVSGGVTACGTACESYGSSACGSVHSRAECDARCASLWSDRVPWYGRAACSNPCDDLCAAAFP